MRSLLCHHLCCWNFKCYLLWELYWCLLGNIFFKLGTRLIKGLQLFDEEEGLKFIVTSCLGDTLLHFIQAYANLLCPLLVGSFWGKQLCPIKGIWTSILFHYKLLAQHCNKSSEVPANSWYKGPMAVSTTTTTSCASTFTSLLSSAWYVFLFCLFKCFLEIKVFCL